MSADQEYMDFLNKANEGTVNSASQAQPNQSYGTTAVNASVPSRLESVQEYYTSDADEPFEPVALQWSGDSLPSLGDFSSLTKTDGKASSIKQKDFDPQGQYSKVVELVKSAGNGDVAFFRVELSGTRLEYWIVSVADGKLIGLKAKAVES